MYFKSNVEGFLPSQPTMFVDGTAYMMTESRRFLSYNLKDDIIRQFNGPEFSYNEVCWLSRDFTLRLEAYGDTIAVLAETEGSIWREEEVSRWTSIPQLTMWILRDKSSSTPTWERKFIVELPVASQNYMVGFMYNGQYLVSSLSHIGQKLTKLLLCDLESSEVTDVRSVDGFHYEDLSCRVDFTSVESLLLLNEDRLDPFVQEGSSCGSMLFTLHDASNLMHQGKNKKRKLR